MPDPQERRIAARFPVNANTSCGFVLPVVMEDYGPARIQNISTDGVGLLLPRDLEIGTVVVMNLTNAAQNFSKTMFLEVVHSTRQISGAFLVGGSFVTPLTYEELRTFVM